MKKRLSLVLALMLLVSLIAGCGGGAADNKSDAGAKDSVKVGFIYVGPKDDGGWSEVHDIGRLEMEKNLEGKVTTIIKESVSEEKSEVLSTIRDMVDQGATIIFGTSFGFMEGMAEAAKEFPDVTFMHCTGYTVDENLGTYFGRVYEPRYLSGMVAGLTTKSNKIAYVAANQIPEVVRGINAFSLGVKAVNPEAKVYVAWTNTWYDPVKEKEAAAGLIQQGCDVTAQHQDSVATMEAAKEAQALSVGYDLSAAESMPEVYMTAPIFHFGDYYTQVVQSVMDGTWKSEQYWGGMKDGVVALDTMTDLVPADVQDKVKEAEAKILSGELFVFSGELKDNNGEVRVEAGKKMTDEEMLSMDWFVDNVVTNK